MSRRTTCTSHCARCGRHFSGDGAFDLHRRGESNARHCVSPIDEPRLTVAAEDAYCAISGAMGDDWLAVTLDPVTVYGLAASRTPDALARLNALSAGVCGDRSSVSRDPAPVGGEVVDRAR